MPDKKNPKKIIAIYLAAAVFSIVAWNIIIGNFIFNQSSILFDNEIGNRHYPKTKFLNTKEGYGNFFTDELGFNNKHISTGKNGKFRILVLGDSITEAAQVSLDKSYTFLLEKYLNDPSGNYEVFNLGFSGRAVPDYINYAEGYKEKFSSDFFILQINYNDFTADATKSSKQNYINIGNDNTFKLVKNTHTGGALGRSIYEKAGWFQPIVAHTVNNFSMSKLKSLFRKGKNQELQAMDDNSSPQQPDESNAGQEERLIGWQLEKLKEKYGNRFVLLYTGIAPFIDNGNIVEKEVDYVSRAKEKIKKECDKFDIAFIDTTDDFLNFYRQSKQLPRGFDNSMPGSGHLNEDGHEILAEILYKFIKGKNL